MCGKPFPVLVAILITFLVGSASRVNIFPELKAQSFSSFDIQVKKHLDTQYCYLNIAYNFQRGPIALFGFYNYFVNLAEYEWSHAIQLMKYANERGRSIVLEPITFQHCDLKGPSKNWTLEAFDAAMRLESKISQNLHSFHMIANENSDTQLQDFLDDILADQSGITKRLADHLTNLLRTEHALRDNVYDEILLEETSLNI